MAKSLSTDDLDVIHRATKVNRSMLRLFLDRKKPRLLGKIVAASHIAITLGRYEELRDPLEDDPKWATKIHEEHEAADGEIKGDGMGRCHLVWQRQAEILWEKYQIRWFSPAEMNPWIMMD